MLFRPQLKQLQETIMRVSGVIAISMCSIAGMSIARPASASIAEHANLGLIVHPVSELMSGSKITNPLKISIPDEKLLDQNGRAVHLYTDLIKGRVVVVSFLFTSCGLVCPMQTIALSKLQRALGERFRERRTLCFGQPGP